MRKTPYKHGVKKHVRNGTIVNAYDRGKGKPTPHKTLNKRIISARKSTITADFIRRLHSKRTPAARKIDESRRAPIAKEYEEWIHAPNKVDVIGVDSAGGFKKVSEIDISKYSNAQLSMNQMGGIYRVDVWDKEGHRLDGPGFKTEKEARSLITAIKNQKPRTEATYNLATGWMRIVFDEKPSRETLGLLKTQGFRYRPSSKAWSAKYGYGREELLKELAGEVKEVVIPVDFEKKAEYYSDKATKTQKEADAKYDRARKTMDLIPIGQPILVGHHSEKKHRGDLKKIESNMRKSIELGDKAKKLQETADRYGAKDEGKENPRTVKNRIKGLEADIRRIKSYSADETGAELKRSKKQIARLEHLLNLQRERYTRTGGVLADTVDFKPGMVVHTTNGKARIKKVSGKSVRVELITDARSLQGPPWNNLKISKDKIIKVYE